MTLPLIKPFLIMPVSELLLASEMNSNSNYNGTENFFGLKNLEFLSLSYFGHIHNPGQNSNDDERYCNTGKWIPVYEIDVADVRPDGTYTFLHIEKDGSGNIKPHNLFRWNNDAMRNEPLVFMDLK